MTLRHRLEAIRQQLGITWEILELDYTLSWVLVGLALVDELRDSLVFKGGTCLKKCYFGDNYRFSKDLDFTAVNAPRGLELESALHRACSKMQEAFHEQVGLLDFALKRQEQRQPHPREQECFTVRVRLPWHRAEHPASWTHVKLEINPSESLSWPMSRRHLQHGYGESLETTLLSAYSLDEITAEKLRAILQFADTLERRAWARSRARDYYDLWRILQANPNILAGPEFVEQFQRKCIAQQVALRGAAAFFQKRLLDEVRTTWSTALASLVPGLPDCEAVLHDLRGALLGVLPE